MKAKHIFEGGIYLVSNVAVARNPLFRNKENFDRFKTKAKKHLSPICKIIKMALHDNQWEILVKVKKREEIEAFYVLKHQLESINNELVPESTFIFSQEIANLQSGFVIHYNWKNKRVGGLFYRRYLKELIGSEEELKSIIMRLEETIPRNPHKGEWAIRKIERIRFERTKTEGAEVMDAKSKNKRLLKILNMDKNDLEAYFQKLPPLQIEIPINRLLKQLFRILSLIAAPS